MKRHCLRTFLVVALLFGLNGLVGRVRAATPFIRGDANRDSALSVSDAVTILRHLFEGDRSIFFCLDAADADDDGAIAVSDAVRLLQHLFLGGPPPEPPGRCGHDRTEDALGCELNEFCVGNAVFFVLDRSGSMREGTKFKRLQAEVVNEISALDDRDQFGVIFFEFTMTKFPAGDQPADGTAAMKAAAIAFVMSTTTGSATCPKPALFAALEYAGQATVGGKSIRYISDGFTHCPGRAAAEYGAETLAEFAAANVDGIPVTAIAVGSAEGVNEPFLRALAEQSGGEYVRIIQ